MAHKAPKNRCYSQSESADYRLASAVCKKNDGENYLLTVQEKLYLSPGKHTTLFAMKEKLKHSRRTIKAKLPSTKTRRNILAQERQALRKKLNREKEFNINLIVASKQIWMT